MKKDTVENFGNRASPRWHYWIVLINASFKRPNARKDAIFLCFCLIRVKRRGTGTKDFIYIMQIRSKNNGAFLKLVKIWRQSISIKGSVIGIKIINEHIPKSYFDWIVVCWRVKICGMLWTLYQYRWSSLHLWLRCRSSGFDLR